MTQKFDNATNELEIFGKTLTVELSGNYFFYPRKILRGPCIAISETGVFHGSGCIICCNNGKVCTELSLTEENLNYALVELRRKCWSKIVDMLFDI